MNEETQQTDGFLPDPMQVQRQDDRIMRILMSQGFENDEITCVYPTPEARLEFYNEVVKKSHTKGNDDEPTDEDIEVYTMNESEQRMLDEILAKAATRPRLGYYQGPGPSPSEVASDEDGEDSNV